MPVYNNGNGDAGTDRSVSGMRVGGLPMPLVVRPPVPLTDEQIIRISHLNKPYRIERNADGELEIMSPVGFDGGQREMLVGFELFDWAKRNGGIVLSSSAGFTRRRVSSQPRCLLGFRSELDGVES